MSNDMQPLVKKSLEPVEPVLGAPSNTLMQDAPGVSGRVEHTCSIPLGNGAFVQVNTAVITPGAGAFEEGGHLAGASLAGTVPDYLGRGAATGRKFVVEAWVPGVSGHGTYLDVSTHRVEVEGKVTIPLIGEFSGKGGFELLGEGRARVWFNDEQDSNARYEAGSELRVSFKLFGRALSIRMARDRRNSNSAWVVANYGIDLPTLWLTNK